MSKKAEDSITVVNDEPKTEPSSAPVGKMAKRHGSRLIIAEDAKAVYSEIQHTPYKGENIEKTIRTDHKYNPRQSGIVGGRNI